MICESRSELSLVRLRESSLHRSTLHDQRAWIHGGGASSIEGGKQRQTECPPEKEV